MISLCTPLAWWRQAHRFAWLLALVLCVVVLLMGKEVNGARRWIAFGGFSVQAAEAGKLLLLVYFAGYLARFHGRLADEPVAVLRVLLMFSAVAVLMLVEPDFGTVVVLAATLCGLLFIAGVRFRLFALILPLAAVAFVLLAYTQPYRLERLSTFVDPWATATTGGYQLTQALIAFGRGELFGLGLGEGVQKLFYLPEAHNDFIFAVIAEELGLVGAISLITLFTVLVLRLLKIARQALESQHFFAGYLVYGVAFLIGLQYLINLGVNMAVLPTKGLTLPFVSYGGNSLIVCSVMLGLAFRAQKESGDG